MRNDDVWPFCLGFPLREYLRKVIDPGRKIIGMTNLSVLREPP